MKEIYEADVTFDGRRFLALVQGEHLSIREWTRAAKDRQVLLASVVGSTNLVSGEGEALRDLETSGQPEHRGRRYELSTEQVQQLAEAALDALRTRRRRSHLFETPHLYVGSPDTQGKFLMLVQSDLGLALEVSRLVPSQSSAALAA